MLLLKTDLGFLIYLVLFIVICVPLIFIVVGVVMIILKKKKIGIVFLILGILVALIMASNFSFG